MGSGCLRPKQRGYPIDLSLLDLIYAESSNFSSFSDNSSVLFDSDNTALSMYQAETKKKGYIKKLADYLNSHILRLETVFQHIETYLKHNCCIVIQYTTILILDQLLSKASSSQERLYSLQNSSQKNSDVFLTKNSSWKTDYNRKQGTEKLWTIEFLKPQIQKRYFQIIHLIINQPDTIYRFVIQNMIKFCGLSDYAFFEERHLCQILEYIRYHIQVDQKTGMSTCAYLAILKRVKKPFIQKIFDNLAIFFKLYTKNTSTDLKVEKSLSEINTIFFQNCCEETQQTQIFKLIIEMMDEYKFENTEHIDQCLSNILDEVELKERFKKGFFLYFLGYLSMSSDKILRQKWKMLYPYEDSQLFLELFPSILEQKTKENAMKKMSNPFFNTKVVKIQNILDYHKTSFVCAILFNLQTSQFSINVSQMISQLTKQLTHQYRVILACSLLSQINNSSIDFHYSQKCKFQVLKLCKSIVESLYHIEEQLQFDQLWMQLSMTEDLFINNELINIGRHLLLKIKGKVFRSNIRQICCFFFSIYDSIANDKSKDSYHWICEILKSYNELIMGLNIGQYRGILLSFTEYIVNEIKQSNKYSLEIEESKKRRYYVDALLFINFKKLGVKNQLINPLEMPLPPINAQKRSSHSSIWLVIDQYINKIQKITLDRYFNIDNLKKKEDVYYQQSKLVMQRDKGIRKWPQQGGMFSRKRSIEQSQSISKKQDNDLEQIMDIL